MKGVVGVVGLGIMGGAMARNLTKAGWEVVGFDIVAERRSEAEAAGIAGADSAAAVAARAPTIIMSLPSAAAAHAVARELAGAKERRVVVETSTLALEDKEEIRRVLEAGGHVALDFAAVRHRRAGADRRPRRLRKRRFRDDRRPSCRCLPAFRARRTISAPSATAAA